MRDVSETALWAATLRARESARPDAMFRDPFAAALAGERGRALAERFARLDRGANGWAMVVRTRLIDELVLAAVAEDCDCVLNLAAGLDARPYRLELPARLHWIEADLPAVIELKERRLRAERPKCGLRRVVLDVTDQRARGRLLSEVLTGSRRGLVLSEGLLIYLGEAQVRGMADALRGARGVWRWVTDIASPGVLASMQRRLGVPLARAPLRFAPASGIGYFESLGWAVRGVEPLLPAGLRWGRVPALLRRAPRPTATDPRRLGRDPWSAVVELERPH
ncbi:MAG TPA: SAM-dependent methyltransferase [Polyangiaceae bacterium]|nr:SAM-dependent methyltransferase [Polyangiaceae bacterium]